MNHIDIDLIEQAPLSSHMLKCALYGEFMPMLLDLWFLKSSFCKPAGSGANYSSSSINKHL